mmetsp:Transcript_30976/g.47840  ORF Transcript_30976/g.47840 Transcript_30976/m.47840 type:complete len:89 (+) Transcript_30976:4139-4405(+)
MGDPYCTINTGSASKPAVLRVYNLNSITTNEYIDVTISKLVLKATTPYLSILAKMWVLGDGAPQYFYHTYAYYSIATLSTDPSSTNTD